MADVTKLVPHILKFEGGYVNDPDDLGGETCKGVCYRTYKLYCSRKKKPIPTIEDLKIDQQGKKKTDKTSEVK